MANKSLSDNKFYPHYLFFAAIFLFIIAADQIIKNLILAEPNSHTLVIIKDFFEIDLLLNHNLSFLNFIAIPSIFYPFITVFLLLFFYKYIYSPLKTSKGKINLFNINAGSALIAAGAVSNLIDRLKFGYVIDYFNIKLLMDAVFNIADLAIFIGSLMLIKEILISKS